MTDTKEQVERRKHRRFPATKNTFVALRPEYIIIGQVKNISTEGLAFTYMADGKRPSQSLNLDIFLVDRTFLLEKVPFTTISDVARDGIPFSSLTIRECTIQFADLTPHQKEELEHFVRNHTLLGTTQEPNRAGRGSNGPLLSI
jgi:hypothetical protein